MEPMPQTIQLMLWQRYAAYCNCCAKSGESDPKDFEEFVASSVCDDLRIASGRSSPIGNPWYLERQGTLSGRGPNIMTTFSGTEVERRLAELETTEVSSDHGKTWKRTADADETDAIAHLMLGAPKMLAALQRFVEANRVNRYEFESNEPEVFRLIELAIAEATTVKFIPLESVYV